MRKLQIYNRNCMRRELVVPPSYTIYMEVTRKLCKKFYFLFLSISFCHRIVVKANHIQFNFHCFFSLIFRLRFYTIPFLFFFCYFVYFSSFFILLFLNVPLSYYIIEKFPSIQIKRPKNRIVLLQVFFFKFCKDSTKYSRSSYVGFFFVRALLNVGKKTFDKLNNIVDISAGKQVFFFLLLNIYFTKKKS